MSQLKILSRVPSYDEMESFFVNNETLERVETYLSRFNPIKTMKMERMEIRHSAILAWLLDPIETHGLGDHFLKAFLGEALRGYSDLGYPTALDISQSDLSDTEVRCEWQNIDIFIYSQVNSWVFIVENKYDSKQHEGQLSKYAANVNSIHKAQGEKLKTRGIFLTLWEEEPQDSEYAPIKYEAICEILERMLTQQPHRLSSEVTTFLNHYLDILKDATGMSDDLDEMKKLAKKLYRDHKKVLDFVVEHGASTDFAIAARTLFGDDPEYLNRVTVGKNDYVFSGLGSNNVSFLPRSWYEAFGQGKHDWPGCEKWWAGYPLICWLQIRSGNDGSKGELSLYSEVGPVSDYEFRKDLIENIQATSKAHNLSRIKFQKGAANEGKKYSKFLKQNSVAIRDIQDPDEISTAMAKLLEEFQLEFAAVSEVLPPFLKFGVSKSS